MEYIKYFGIFAETKWYLKATEMINLVEKLERYFQLTSRDVVLSDWEKTLEFDKVGPILDDFLSQVKQSFQIRMDNPITAKQVSSNNLSLKYSSGIFFNN